MKNQQRIGYMERKAHERFPRYATHIVTPRTGVTEKTISGGFLRVTYRDTEGWEYQLDGQTVSRETAMAAFGPEA